MMKPALCTIDQLIWAEVITSAVVFSCSGKHFEKLQQEAYVEDLSGKRYLNKSENKLCHRRSGFARGETLSASVTPFVAFCWRRAASPTSSALMKVWWGYSRGRVNHFATKPLPGWQNRHVVLHFTTPHLSHTGDASDSKTFVMFRDGGEKHFLVALFCHNKSSQSCAINAS